MSEICHDFDVPATLATSSDLRELEQQGHLFRGRILAKLAIVEAWVTTSIATIDASLLKNGNGNYYFGHKFETVKGMATKSESPFEQSGSLTRLLKELQPYVDARVVLAHGTMQVGLDKKGNGLIVFDAREVTRVPIGNCLVVPASEVQQLFEAVSKLANEISQVRLRKVA